MFDLLSNIAFTNPWILAGLIALPALWLLLRITPPAPRRIALPTTRFLAGLIPEEQTPSKTPLLILLLRILIAALVLLALAQPVYNPRAQLGITGPIRIVIDNDWAAAQTWRRQKEAAENLLGQATREGQNIYILTTAEPSHFGPLPAGEALSIIRAMDPLPWPADTKAVLETLEDNKPDSSITSYWFSHGLEFRRIPALFKQLQAQGPLTYFAPTAEDLPQALKSSHQAGTDLQVTVLTAAEIPNGLPVSVQAIDKKGRILDRQKITLTDTGVPTKITFDLPESLRNQISQFRLNGRASAGTTLLLDDQLRRRSIGIVAPADQVETAPLIEAGYYLKRALEPFAQLHFGEIGEILDQDPAMIIMPDIGAMSAKNLNMLEAWINKGGLLLRFAGPAMAENKTKTALIPVPLRRGGRSLDGAMTWDNPAKLGPFEDSSPFYGLRSSEDITVRQQLLAEPIQDIDQKTWARLEDGTPLITASPQNKGLLVMIHTTATPDWSDLALSGLYVEILQRLAAMAGKAPSAAQAPQATLEPIRVLDGFGALKDPEAGHKPIPADRFSTLTPSAEHPPGIYARAGLEYVLNLGDRIEALKAANPPLGVLTNTYGGEREWNLMPYLLYTALALLILDWLVMIIMATGLRSLVKFAGIAFLIFAPLNAQAQTPGDLTYADGFFLAYMQTGNAAIDNTTHTGLENLGKALARRTSAEPDGVVGLNPETSELAFFPILYWPITGDETTLSPAAAANIQAYLNNGGTILFDTRDQHFATSRLSGTKNAAALRQMISGINIPPLGPMPKDHVMSKSFYLLKDMPGRHSGGRIWVEQQSNNGRDGVSSVIIGGHDRGGAWAATRSERTALAGGARQQELAIRFGVNLVMYALTGNYKADQVHVPHILQRLDR